MTAATDASTIGATRHAVKSSSPPWSRCTARSIRTTPARDPPIAQVSRPDVSVDFTSVQLLDVSRHFGRRRALSRLSLSAASGDIIGLLGPNGAGKSTLITILATLATPTSGEVRYGEQTAARLGGALRIRIGLLAHELHLYPELSA